MKKVFLFFLMIFLLSLPSFATQRAQLDDGNGNILGTAANPIHTTGGSGGGGTPAGSSGQIQYNSSGSFAGANVYQDSNGNVGIGSPNPGQALDVQGTVRAINFIGSGAGLTGISGVSGITSSGGNIGVGSINPGTQLDVQGTLRVSGVIQSSSIANDQVFNVKSYGANGDGIHGTDGIITSGSNAFSSASANFTVNDVGKVIVVFAAGTMGNSATAADGAVATGTPTAFTSASASFAASDNGKIICIAGAGSSGNVLCTTFTYVSSTSLTLTNAASTTVTSATYYYGNAVDLTTTIAAFVDSHDITLTAIAGNSVGGVDYDYGTDDTVSIQSAINAVGTNGTGTVFFPKGEFIINGAFGTNPASQLYLPNIALYFADSGGVSAPQQNIRLLGTNKRNLLFSQVDNNGSILYFTKIGTSGQSGIGIYGTGNVLGEHFSNEYVQIENLSFKTVSDPAISAVDMSQAINLFYDGNQCEHNYDLSLNANAIIPTGTSSYCLKTPQLYNSGFTIVQNSIIGNYRTGVWVGEHTDMTNMLFFLNYTSMEFPVGQHARNITNIDSECNYQTFNFTGSSAETSITNLDAGTSGCASWSNGGYVINDPSNYATGQVTTTYGVPSQSGGTGLTYNNINAGAIKFASTSTIGGNINATGNIGIGTLNPPNLLSVVGQSNSYVRISPTSAGTSGTGVILSGVGGQAEISNNTWTNTTPQNVNLSLVTGFVETMVNNADSFFTTSATLNPTATKQMEISNVGVGIGNVVPLNPFDVKGGTAIGSNYAGSNPVPTNGLIVQGNVGLGTSTPGATLDVWGTVSRFLVQSTGNVGIGSSTPGSILDVQGTIRGISGGTCTTLYRCQGGTDAGIIQTAACTLCPASTCVAMNGCF